MRRGWVPDLLSALQVQINFSFASLTCIRTIAFHERFCGRYRATKVTSKMLYTVDFFTRPFDHFLSSENFSAFRQDRSVVNDDAQWGGPEPAPAFQIRRADQLHQVLYVIQDAATVWYPADVSAVFRAVHGDAVQNVPVSAPTTFANLFEDILHGVDLCDLSGRRYWTLHRDSPAYQQYVSRVLNDAVKQSVLAAPRSDTGDSRNNRRSPRWGHRRTALPAGDQGAGVRTHRPSYLNTSVPKYRGFAERSCASALKLLKAARSTNATMFMNPIASLRRRSCLIPTDNVTLAFSTTPVYSNASDAYIFTRRVSGTCDLVSDSAFIAHRTVRAICGLPAAGPSAFDAGSEAPIMPGIGEQTSVIDVVAHSDFCTGPSVSDTASALLTGSGTAASRTSDAAFIPCTHPCQCTRAGICVGRGLSVMAQTPGPASRRTPVSAAQLHLSSLQRLMAVIAARVNAVHYRGVSGPTRTS
ncbi:hypothetical protein PHPALM_31440 [Phytophthora palmivora]|uniref:Uncharacterized protein n=1 Tax=Phytophthora palmivora TaxID=4796 RepID=A0A2P4X2J7_9STRA|nr:hypothetical protein PHPALM_31440 [Phytophthora palmivora]